MTPIILEPSCLVVKKFGRRRGTISCLAETQGRIIVRRQREREALAAGSSSSSSSRTHQPPASLAVRTQPVMLLKPVKEELWSTDILGFLFYPATSYSNLPLVPTCNPSSHDPNSQSRLTSHPTPPAYLSSHSPSHYPNSLPHLTPTPTPPHSQSHPNPTALPTPSYSQLHPTPNSILLPIPPHTQSHHTPNPTLLPTPSYSQSHRTPNPTPLPSPPHTHPPDHHRTMPTIAFRLTPTPISDTYYSRDTWLR
ncbi:hypothetical protein Pcinc_039897 [Petrolisthes cinctipes]|uniref:Uncharacterized protein n=1 Tax=Petrolisthes cinctipes TaxID=88211 RepID=A0AAE1BMY2_PETCI|nr:hypothetical protein Pcinc_039897 [Petrolisthes cinctipes]